MSQTSIGQQEDIFPGVFAPRVPRHHDTFANEGPASVPIGAVVIAGSTSDFAVLPVDGTGRVLGVVAHSHLYAPSEIDDVGLVAGVGMSVMSEGLVAVRFDDAATPSDTPRVRRRAPDWQALTAYDVGDRVTNDGKIYECTVAGNSAAAGGPVHSAGTAVDGTVTWLFLAVGVTTGQIGAFRVGALTDETVPIDGVEILDTVSAGGVGWIKLSQPAFGTPD